MFLQLMFRGIKIRQWGKMLHFQLQYIWRDVSFLFVIGVIKAYWLRLI